MDGMPVLGSGRTQAEEAEATSEETKIEGRRYWTATVGAELKEVITHVI